MMTHRPVTASLVVALLASVGLVAQTTTKPGDLGFTLKLHGGATAGNLKDDLHSQSMLGLGFEGSWALSSTGAIIGEFTFSSFGGGEGYDNTKFSGPIYIAGPVDNVGGQPIYLRTSSSVDYRKNTLQGFSLRAGYRGTFAGSWSWQAGLSLDGLKYRQEASGQLQPLYTLNPPPPPPAPSVVAAGPYEGFALTPTKTKFGVGAFAGVKFQFSDNFSLETNLISVGYGNLNYQPFTYTGQAPATSSETRRGILLEVAFGMKL
jgi:opacity protein-like surface antigen